MSAILFFCSMSQPCPHTLKQRLGQVGGITVASTDGTHEIKVEDCQRIRVTGVASVERFDLQEFLLTTRYGPLHITGNELHMKHLDLQAGVVLIEGKFESMNYLSEQSKRKKLNVKRVFR